MSGSVGVQLGRPCPQCGLEDSVPLIWGLPGIDLMQLAERGLVSLGGCMVPGDDPAWHCRACGLDWGRPGDPTADEQALADLLGVGWTDVLRALGGGWRRESAPGEDGVEWFVSGEPAQVAVGVHGPWFQLVRPLTRWGESRLDLQPADVMDTATFYEEYWLKPKGKYLVQVCRSLSCELCGSDKLTEHVKQKLGLE